MESHVHRMSKSARIITSCAVWFGTFSFGLTYNFISPALVELKNKYGTTIEDISRVFTVILIFYMFGALTCTFIYRFINRQLTTAAMLFTVAACIIIIPHLPSMTLFFITGGVLGFASGGYDTSQIAWILEMWHLKAGKYVQIQHFSWAVGTVITPLLLKPFLLEESQTHEGINGTSNFTLPHATLNGTSTSLLDLDNPRQMQKSQLYIPFSIGGGIVGLAGTIILFLYVFMKYEPPRELPMDKTEDNVASNCTAKKIILIALTAAFLGCYQGMEVCTFQFLPTFTHYIDLRLPEPQGASILSGLTGAFTVGRLLGVIASILNVKPIIILAMNLTLTLCGDLTLYFFANDSLIGLWAGVIWLGLGFSTIFPCIYDYVEKHFKVTNAVAAVMVVSGAVVAAVYPLIVGRWVEKKPAVLTYVVFGSIVVSVLTLVVLYLLTMGRTWKKTVARGQFNVEMKVTNAVS